MNLRNFKEEIDKVILGRGYDYYQNGHILDLYEQDNQTYIFEIEGTTDYEVIVQLDNYENIIYSYCNCPYDFGMICKHEVAAYFKLQEIRYAQNQENTNIKKPSIREILNTLSKEQLIELLFPVIKKDKSLEKKYYPLLLKGAF